MDTSFIENPIFLLFCTFALYTLAKYVQVKTKILLLSPIPVTIVLVILCLELFGIRYETYNESGQFVSFWMQPAVVALGVPLYLQLDRIKKQLLPILLSQMVGCVVGVVSVVLIAQALGASKEVILSLASKSVTMPISMEVTRLVGGLPSLTAAAVACVGIFGGMFGFQLFKLFRLDSGIAQGLAMGTASHALGTSVVMERSPACAVYSSLGLTLNGVLTALVTPAILEWLGLLA